MTASQWKKTALHCAADKGDASVAEALIKLGADINASEKVCSFIACSYYEQHVCGYIYLRS